MPDVRRGHSSFRCSSEIRGAGEHRMSPQSLAPTATPSVRPTVAAAPSGSTRRFGLPVHQSYRRRRSSARPAFLPGPLTPRLAHYVALEGRTLHRLADRNRSNRLATPACPPISSHSAAVICIEPSPAAPEVLRHCRGSCNGEQQRRQRRPSSPIVPSRAASPSRGTSVPFAVSLIGCRVVRSAAKHKPKHVGAALRRSQRGPRPCCPA